MTASLALRFVSTLVVMGVVGAAVAVPASQGLASQGLASHSLASQGSASQGKYLNTTLQNKAIAPTCSTVLVPLSSTCNVGVNTVSGNDKRQLQGTAANKAILPSCSTIYSTSTSCNAGVHPQPTFTGAPVTVTQLTYPSVSAAPVTTTVTTIADLSVSATLAGTSAASDYIFFLTPTLQQDIIDIAETFCTPARQKRQIASAPSCSLDPSYQQAFVNGVASLVDGDVIATGTQLAPGLAAIVIGAEIFKLWSTSSVQPLGLSLGVGGGDVSSVVSSAGSSSSQPPPAPTLYPGPPNCNYTSMESSDIFLLTSYWAAAFDLVTTSSSACHFGTSVGISSTQSYCICTDGFYHSISPVTITTTVNGSPTQTVDYCPYTSIPSATIAAGPTIASPLSIPPPTSLVAPTSSAASLSLSAPTCFSGPSAFKDKDMSSGISEFCASASKSGWSVTQTTALTTYGQFSNGAAAYKFTSILAGPTTSPSPTKSGPTSVLAIQVTFETAACDPGQPLSLDLTDDTMCKTNFLSIENDCDTVDNAGAEYWKHGGAMYANCAAWSIDAVEL